MRLGLREIQKCHSPCLILFRSIARHSCCSGYYRVLTMKVRLVRSLVRSFVRSFARSFARSLVRSFVLSYVRSFVRSFFRTSTFVRSDSKISRAGSNKKPSRLLSTYIKRSVSLKRTIFWDHFNSYMSPG